MSQILEVGRRLLVSARPAAPRHVTTAHLLITSGAAVLYVLSFGPLYGIVGAVAPMSVTFPVLLSAVYFGAVTGALVGLAAFPLNALLVTVLTDVSWTAWAVAGGTAGTGLTAFVAYIVGRQRELMWDLVCSREEQRHLSVERDRLASIVECAEDLAWVADGNGRLIYLNPSARRVLGVAPDADLATRNVASFHPSWMNDRLATVMFPAAARDGNWRGEGAWLTHEGREVHTSMIVHAHRDPHGDIEFYSTIAHDLSDQRRAADALRASEERLRVVLSNVPLVLWAADSRGVATFCGGRALEPLGGTPEDIVGRPFDAIRIDPFPALGADLRRVLAGESVNSRIDVRELTFETWSAPLHDERNHIAGATGIIVDITERRRLEVELSNAQKLEAIGRLAGGIAHDFNNNLTAILGYVEMMLVQIDKDTPIARDLQEVQRAAQRAAALVRRLLAFGRRQVLQPRNLNLNTLIEGLQPMLERLIGEVVHIDVALASDLLSITGDAGELEQVIMNLALNARDAMPAGGTMTIETSLMTAGELRRPILTSGAYVLMTIRDTGAGMDSRVKEHVFEPFFTTKPEGQGTGLGLSTVYGIVKQLDGFIWVESEIGQGSTFQVYLPVAVDEAVPEPVSSAPTMPPPTGQRETILLVEDEHTVRRFAKLALERHGFLVVEAATPEEALSLAAASEQPLSLLLTDVVMPRINGRELADRLKQIRPDLPVLYMSGYPSSLVLQDGLIEPSMRLMSKPFTMTELMAGVHEALGEQ